jgi:urease accessory protein
MGAAADRITAADFVTPPELYGLPLAADGTGRIGGVRLALVADGGRTRLGRCYQQVPLRVLPPFPCGPGQPALLYLLNPTAGLLDGDAHRVQLHAGCGTRAVVTGQSATRIHPAVHGYCTQHWVVGVEAGAVLVVLPGPAIPFQGCRYYQKVEIELAEGAGLVWGDLWLAGRYARGPASERFRFETVVQDLAVRRDGRLVYRDRFCWQGPWDEPAAAWHFGGMPACGSLFVTGQGLGGPVFGEGSTTPGAVLPTAFGDTCVRWHGPVEAVTARLVYAALSAGARLAGAQDGTWLLPTAALAPNHWFCEAARSLAVQDDGSACCGE